MQFRFQEPDTAVEPVEYQVTAKLDDQRYSVYVSAAKHWGWELRAHRGSSYVIERIHQLGTALDKAREEACRGVKAAVLDAEANRIRQG